MEPDLDFLYLRRQEYVEPYLNTVWGFKLFIMVLLLFSNGRYSKQTCTKL
jgi:hypothetical protein